MLTHAYNIWIHFSEFQDEKHHKYSPHMKTFFPINLSILYSNVLAEPLLMEISH